MSTMPADIRQLYTGAKPLGPPPLRVIPRLLTLGLLCLPPFNRLYAKWAAGKIRRATRVIALCKGNTCRSPFLAEYLRHRADALGISLPPVISRGILPGSGDRSSPTAIETAARFGVDLASHASCSIQEEKPRAGDVFLIVMPPHVADLARLFPGAKYSMIYVGLLDPAETSPFVLDPYNGSAETYFHTYGRLRRAVDRLLGGMSRP